MNSREMDEAGNKKGKGEESLKGISLFSPFQQEIGIKCKRDDGNRKPEQWSLRGKIKEERPIGEEEYEWRQVFLYSVAKPLLIVSSL